MQIIAVAALPQKKPSKCDSTALVYCSQGVLSIPRPHKCPSVSFAVHAHTGDFSVRNMPWCQDLHAYLEVSFKDIRLPVTWRHQELERNNPERKSTKEGQS